MGVENIKKAEKENKRRVIISVIKITVLLLIVIGIPLYIWFFHGDWIRSFENIDDVVAFLEKYETQSIFVYITEYFSLVSLSSSSLSFSSNIDILLI